MIAAALRLATEEQWTTAKLEKALHNGLDILENLHYALNCYYGVHRNEPPPPLSSPPNDVLWRHRDMNKLISDGPKYQDGVAADRQALESATSAYMDVSWWRDPALELLLVDSLVYAEVNAFAEHQRFTMALSNWNAFRSGATERSLEQLGKKRLWREVWLFLLSLVFRWALPAGVILGIADSTPGTAAALAVLYSAYLIRQAIFKVHDAPNDAYTTAVKLLGKMTVVYAEIGRRPTSPKYLLELLLSSTKDGASWPQTAIALLDRATHRGDYVWK